MDSSHSANVHLSADPANGQLAGRCPRCYLDFRFTNPPPTPAAAQGSGKCQLYRYRRAGRRQRKLRSSAASGNSKLPDAALSKKSIEFLRTVLSIVGQRQVSGPEFTPENLSQLVASFTQQAAVPRIGLFIEALPPVLQPSSDNFVNYADILLTIARRLSTNSSQQIDRETQSISPSVVTQMKLMDSSVQCDQDVNLIDLPMNITILERHLDWTPVSVSSIPALRLRSESKRSLPPIAKRVIFTPGEDLIMKLGGIPCIKDDDVQIRSISDDIMSNPVCTVEEIPSNLVVKPRCKDVTSLPVQRATPHACAPRSHRSCTQSEYLTKTAMSLLNESTSSANVYALLNSDSFNSEKSKRNLGNFLLKERMKRILSNILSEHKPSKTSLKSDEKFGNPSSATRYYHKPSKYMKRNGALKWELDKTSRSGSMNVSSNESVSVTKSCTYPKPILIGRCETPKTSNTPVYIDSCCQCDSEIDMDDVEQEELRVLRQILLRSCSFTETETACHLSLALDRRSLLQAVMAALQNCNSEDDLREMRRFLPRDSCSFAEYLPLRGDHDGECARTAGGIMDTDVITITTQIRCDDDALFGDNCGEGISCSRFVEKYVQTDDNKRMVGRERKAVSWSRGLRT